MQNDQDGSSRNSFLKIFGIATVLIFLFAIIFYQILAHIYANYPSSPSVLGDSFGLFEAIISGLAFAGIITALYLQRSDLELQRNELKLTREELQGQKENLKEQANILKRQSDLLKKQKFETTLFQLINNHIEAISKLRFAGQEEIQALERVNGQLQTKIKELHQDNDLAEAAIAGYDWFINERYQHFGHIVNSFEFIVEFISQQSEDDREAKEYLDMFITQLPNYEKAILYYFCFYCTREQFFQRALAWQSLAQKTPQEILYLEKHILLDYITEVHG